MTDEEGGAGEGGRRVDTVLRHALCALVALVSFAVSAPTPLRLPHLHADDLRRASIVQLDDDDDDRETLVALVEEDEGDDEADEPAL